MKKYKLTRGHLGKSAGDELELTPEQENYFLRVGLIKSESEKTEKDQKKANTNK